MRVYASEHVYTFGAADLEAFRSGDVCDRFPVSGVKHANMDGYDSVSRSMFGYDSSAGRNGGFESRGSMVDLNPEVRSMYKAKPVRIGSIQA